jgi:hypothetical protein
VAALLSAAACSKRGPHGASGALRFQRMDAVPSLEAEAQKLGSPEIAARVVNHRDLTNDLAYGGSFAAATQKVAGMLKARTVGADTLEVTIESQDPKQAIDLCNVALGAYLEMRLQKQMMLNRVPTPGSDTQFSNDAHIVQTCKYH